MGCGCKERREAAKRAAQQIAGQAGGVLQRVKRAVRYIRSGNPADLQPPVPPGALGVAPTTEDPQKIVARLREPIRVVRVK